MALKKLAKGQQTLVTRLVALIPSLLPFELKNDLWQFLPRTANNFYMFIPPQASVQTL